ncbi:MAG: NGG1p interacting factor NIF3 [Nitrospirae bacterium GWC2_57_13]|nr:MAG: NGG1p interacting factor NIF3 [Nitrospirae bacterium GWC1_57_7]OGW26656.1 MAG: NGG1p interacting factor NIF3 [Nitrospirae bacterium GWC2_57_13]OGW44986.1 MAG: NGG1p interacting factor NIF3 [Nitrospirae bacterium GWD2_57_8]HAR44774.1 NGG1p interacting factor NIF3 [Nitrospiraceae bacterium]
MNLRQFFDLAIQTGIDADPRGRQAVERELVQVRTAFDELKPVDREFFDRESLSNPYADSRILHGDPERAIRKVFVGVDIETAELVLADRLNEKGAGIDLVVSHHPEGRAYATIYDVMKMQADILHRFGVPINVAEGILSGRMKEVERKLMPLNHNRSVDAARLLDIPFLCLHTPGDNMVAGHLQRLFEEQAPHALRDVITLLRDIPEYQAAARNNTGPKILLGSDDRRVGKLFVDMTGGTSGPKDSFEKLARSGVGTLVMMHLSEDNRKEAEKHHVNIIVAGHIASDTLGMNLLLDAVEKSAPLEVLECSGFTRIRRSG